MGLTITDERLAQMIRDLVARRGVAPVEALPDAVEKEADRQAERKVAEPMAIVAHPRPPATDRGQR